MVTKKIRLENEFELTYDEGSAEFKEALEGYRDGMHEDATAEDVLLHVAFYVVRFGIDAMVEGVGYVGYNGRKPTEKPDSGIMVSEDYDDFQYSIQW